MKARLPIGVFDSGVGGLSVLREIRRELAHEDLLYVADSAHVPYGDKSSAFIEARSIATTEFLLRRNAKAVVVACNTATGAAIKALRSRFRIPIVATEPAIKPAVANSRSGIIGVLATPGTLTSEKFANLVGRFSTNTKTVVQPCVGLVEQIEEGDLSGDHTRALVEKYVAPLLAQGADTIVLGCTHYPFLTGLIQELAGPGITVLDPSPAVARELRRQLEGNGLLSRHDLGGVERFYTTGSLDKANRVIGQLWGTAVGVRYLTLGEADGVGAGAAGRTRS